MFFYSNFNINIKEFRVRTFYICISIILTFISSFFFKVELFFFISKFFLYFEDGFIYTNLWDPLLIYIKISLLFALLFSSPIIFYIYAFFFFKAIYTFYIYYIIFYIVSFYFWCFTACSISYFKIFPWILKFLLEFQRLGTYDPFKLVLKATIEKYFLFFFTFISLFFIIFIFCNIFLFFINLNNSKIFFNYRKILYLVIFIFLLVFAPPDIILQLMFFPFIIISVELLIYFVSFWYNLNEIYQKKMII